MIDKRKDLPCAVVKDLLPLYHDGVVNSDTRDLIEAHLEGCESCRNELDSIHYDENIEVNLIEQENASFKEFRDGVKALRRNGTIKGLLIAFAALACCFGMLVFLNNESIVKINPSDLKIEDVCRYDLGENGGEGLFFTCDVCWSGGWSVTFEDTKDPKEINILIKRTFLGEKMESDSRNPRTHFIVDDFYTTDIRNISTAEAVKVNGHTIWTKDQSIDNDPPEYIAELVKQEKGYDDMNPANEAISSRIDSDSVSITYADLHGIKWDKKGNVIARFTVDENENIISMESVPSNEKGN